MELSCIQVPVQEADITMRLLKMDLNGLKYILGYLDE